MSEAAPAGFWRRYAAWSLDWLLLAPLLLLLVAPLLARAWRQCLDLQAQVQSWVATRLLGSGDALPSPTRMANEMLHDPALAASVQAASDRLGTTLGYALLLVFVPSAIYFVACEAGPWQGTLGKRLLRLRVRTPAGGRIGPLRALGRHLGGALSWALLNLGHALAGWRADHRALHDLLAGTQVFADGPMPPWARAWLMAQAALLAALMLGLLGWLGWLLLQIARL